MEYDELNDAIWYLYNDFYSDLYEEDGTNPIAVYAKYTCYMSHVIGLAYSQGQITKDEYEVVASNYGYIAQEMLEAARLRKKGY